MTRKNKPLPEAQTCCVTNEVNSFVLRLSFKQSIFRHFGLNHSIHMDVLRSLYELFEASKFQLYRLSMEGQKALRFYQKDLHLCSEDERKSYGLERHEGE